MTWTPLAKDPYLDALRSWIPSDVVDRAVIVQEVESVIVEREGAGERFESIADQLGDPRSLAESYLVDVPMEPARIGARVAAKGIDAVVFFAMVVLLWFPYFQAVLSFLVNDITTIWSPAILLRAAALMLLPGLVPILCEWRWGRTLGKRMVGIRVVTERGTRISFGQALMRYIPIIGQFFWIDVAFVFFNDQRQRAFEKLSHTRVIVSR